MQKVDVKAVKRKLTIYDCEAVCQSLNIRQYSKSSNQIIYYNADKHKDLSAQTPKLYFYLDTKIYMSWTKGCSYDLFGLVQAVKSTNGEPCSFLEAVNYVLKITKIDETVLVSSDSKDYVDWSALEKFVKIKRGETILPVYEDNILNQLPSIYPTQWVDEGIGLQTMEKYGIKYYSRLNQTCIPVRATNGNLTAIRVRNWKPELIDEAKYKPLTLLNGFTYKCNTNDILFGINYNKFAIEEQKAAIIVESEKAVMKLDTWYGDKNIAVGMFGSNLGQKRKKQLLQLGVNRVIYVVDNDWIGKDKQYFQEWKTKIDNFIDLWNGYAQVEIVWDNLNILDAKENATDKDFETWQKLFEAREVIE